MGLNSRYSNYVLIGIAVILVIGIIAGNLSSGDLDEVCGTDGGILYRNNGVWECYQVFENNNTWYDENYFMASVNATQFIVNASEGYSGYCTNTTYLGGIAVGCND